MEKKTFAAVYFGLSYLTALYALASMNKFGLLAAVAIGPAAIIGIFRAAMKLHGEA